MKISYYLGTAIFYLTCTSLTHASNDFEIKEIEEDDRIAEKLEQSVCPENAIRNVPTEEELNELLNHIFPCSKFNNSKYELDDNDFEIVEHGADDADGYFVVGASPSSEMKSNCIINSSIRVCKLKPLLGLFPCQPIMESLSLFMGRYSHLDNKDQVVKDEKS